jgi:anti-sigma-K factor RskA
MIQPCDRFAGQWDLLVLGVLDADPSAEMRAHAAAGCARCQAGLQAALRVAGAMGAALEPAAPPAHVEARLLERLAALDAADTLAREPRPSRWRAPALRVMAAAALVAFAVLIWRDLDQRRELAELRTRLERQAAAPAAAVRPGDPPGTPTATPAAPATSGAPIDSGGEWALERARLQAAVERANTARSRAEIDAARWREELQRLERTLAATTAPAATPPPPGAPEPRAGDEARLREERDRLAADVRRLEAEGRREAARARSYMSALQVALEPGSRRTALRAIDRAAGGATASAVLTADGRLIVTTRDLPPLGSDKCYQLWIIRRDTPAVVSGGVLDQASGQVVHVARVEGRPEAVTGFAITDEPAGGSVSSRGRKLLFGALQ